MSTEVELVINCYERTFREVLAPGYWPSIIAQHRYDFARRTALINNCDDLDLATRMAEALVALGEIDAFHVVAERLDDALRTCGLARRDLGRLPHHSDCALVAVCLPGPPYLLYWDSEVRLVEPVDWISPAIKLLEADHRVLVANPNSPASDLERECLEASGDFRLGYGFSDMAWLVRRAELAMPIYRYRCLASWRYPAAHIATVFEARVDAYMRCHRRLRATYLGATFYHPPQEFVRYPARSLGERWRLLQQRLAMARLRRSRSDDPRRRIYWR